MLRYEDDRSVRRGGHVGRPRSAPVGSRQELDGDNVDRARAATQRTARIDDYEARRPGRSPRPSGSIGVRSVGRRADHRRGPAVGRDRRGVDERGGRCRRTPSRASGSFTELMATAIANTESRARGRPARGRAGRAAAGRDARRAGVPVTQVYAAVGDEVGRPVRRIRRGRPLRAGGPRRWSSSASRRSLDRLPVGDALDARRRPGPGARVPAQAVPSGSTRWTGRASASARRLASPIVVGGRPWGAVDAATGAALPPDAEGRVEKFTDLVGDGDRERRGARERSTGSPTSRPRCAGSRRSSPRGPRRRAVLDAVAAEMRALLDADQVALNRFEAATRSVVAHRGLDVGAHAGRLAREHRGRERDRDGCSAPGGRRGWRATSEARRRARRARPRHRPALDVSARRSSWTAGSGGHHRELEG